GRRCAAAAGPPHDVARAYQNLAIPPPVDGAPGASARVGDSRKEGDQTVTRNHVQPALGVIPIDPSSKRTHLGGNIDAGREGRRWDPLLSRLTTHRRGTKE